MQPSVVQSLLSPKNPYHNPQVAGRILESVHRGCLRVLVRASYPRQPNRQISAQGMAEAPLHCKAHKISHRKIYIRSRGSGAGAAPGTRIMRHCRSHECRKNQRARLCSALMAFTICESSERGSSGECEKVLLTKRCYTQSGVLGHGSGNAFQTLRRAAKQKI